MVHDRETDYRFVMKDELVRYCVEDVNILCKACLKFRRLSLGLKDVDPFKEAVTIASMCNLVFHKCFLRTETIAVIPGKGYRPADNQSKIALQYLWWLGHSENLDIIHAGLGREVRLLKIPVDGLCMTNNTIYRFYGCYYHGCFKCFPIQTITESGDVRDAM